MDDKIVTKVALQTDTHGMVGRECPECKQYFKLKPGTGLPTSQCHCPYCKYEGESGSFTTQAQREYAISVAVKQVVEPILKDFRRDIEGLGRGTRSSPIQLRFTVRLPSFPIAYYSEEDLETLVKCDACGLEFAIYDLFARCPDCTRLTTMSVFTKSLEITRKHFEVLDRIPKKETQQRELVLAHILSSCVAAFDGLGKRLRDENPSALPDKPRNLFQNLDALDEVLVGQGLPSLEQLLGLDKYQHMYRLFQVRHLWEHNFGEVDESFIAKTGCDRSLLKKKYMLTKREVAKCVDIIEQAGIKIRSLF